MVVVRGPAPSQQRVIIAVWQCTTRLDTGQDSATRLEGRRRCSQDDEGYEVVMLRGAIERDQRKS